jgi:hypothetical protein
MNGDRRTKKFSGKTKGVPFWLKCGELDNGVSVEAEIALPS